MDLRCFIAADLPDELKRDIGDLIRSLKKCGGDIKWVVPEMMHLTLKFLGSTRETAIDGISDALSLITHSSEPFYIKIHGTGVFPNRKSPRVVWIGVHDTSALVELQGRVEEAMMPFGYEKEARAFMPHLTLGRVRSPKGILRTVQELDGLKEKDFGSVFVRELKLMKSELKPGGAQYTCLRSFRLGSEK